MAPKAHIVTVGGKGGVGKTSVSAVLAKLLLATTERLLLIDADPVISFSYTLGENPERTLGDFRHTLIEVPSRRKEIEDRPIKDVIRDLVTRSSKGYDLLAMGRAEGKGCFCGVNELLRFGIESLCGDYDAVLIDCEAGIEQVNRRAVHRIDDLILIADTSRRSMESLVKVRDIATHYNEGRPLGTHVVVNRVSNEEDRARARKTAEELGLTVAAFVPEDPNILAYNAGGRPLFDLPEDSPSVAALEQVLAGISPQGRSQNANRG